MSEHLRQAWGQRVEAWNMPDTIRGYPLPQGGQFAHSKEFLDPHLFDHQERMHPWIRESLIAILEAFWRPRYGEWQSWTRIYLAGSLASYWWSTPDFDTLVGVDTHAFVKAHPEFRGFSDHEVCQHLTHEFIQELDPLVKDWTFPPAVNLEQVMHSLHGPDVSRIYDSAPAGLEPFGPMEMTWFCNGSAYDIRNIRPYAAYDVTQNKWAVHPDRMDKHWGAHALGHQFWSHMADVADEIKAALRSNSVEQCKTVYDRIHDARGQAFSPLGRGVTDTRSLQWIVLNRWGLLGPLEVAAHPGREMAHIPPALASKYHFASEYQGGHTFEFEKAEPNAMGGKSYHTLRAVDDQGHHAGAVLWHHKSGEVQNIHVAPGNERKGLATEMWNRAKDVAVTTRGVKPPRHSPDRTEKGDAWAKSLGERLPRLM